MKKKKWKEKALGLESTLMLMEGVEEAAAGRSLLNQRFPAGVEEY